MIKEIKTPYDIDFSQFKNRENKMKDIYRYSNFYDFYYRSHIYVHSLRIFYMILDSKENIINTFPEIDFNKLLITALVHDDVEILIGDFQSPDKKNLAKQAIKKLGNIEEQAIKELSKQFPKKIEGYTYQELLLEILNYSSTEAQIVKFFDHIDGLCEALHEFYAGNKCVVTMYKDKFGKKGILPFDYYTSRFKKASSIYNKLEKLFNKEYKDFSPFKCNFERIDFEKQIEKYNPHNLESLQKDFNYPLYQYWKDIMLKSKDKQVIDVLINFSEKRFYER